MIRETSMLSTDTQVVENQYVLDSTVGDKVNLATNKRTILYFFAPWCSVCHVSIANLQQTYQKNPNINVIAIGLDFMEKEEIDNFVARHELTFPVVYGNEKVKHDFQITGYPSYYVLNEENTIVNKSMGYSTEIGLYLRSL